MLTAFSFLSVNGPFNISATSFVLPILAYENSLNCFFLFNLFLPLISHFIMFSSHGHGG